MKNAFLIFVLMVWTNHSFAQIIDIPDVNFKNALVNTKCIDVDGDGISDKDADENNDGEIDVSEALAVKTILSSIIIDSLTGINYFENLERLSIGGINTLNGIYLNKLNYFYLNNSQIKVVNINIFPNLIVFNSFFCSPIKKLDLSNHHNLKVVGIAQMNIDTINILNNKSLRKLDLYCNIDHFINDTNTNIDTIVLENNEFFHSNINLSSFQKLKYLYLGDYQNTLDLKDLPNLEYINPIFFNLDTINLSNLPKIKELHIKSYTLKSLSLNLNNLETLYLERSAIQNFDLNNLTNLESLNIDLNSNLLELKIEELDKLKIIHITNNNSLQILKIDKLSNLDSLYLSNNDALNTFSLSKTQNLRTINLVSPNITDSLIIENLLNLKYIYIWINKLKYYKLHNLPELSEVHMNAGPIKNLIFSDLPKLSTLNASSSIDSDMEIIRLPSLKYLGISDYCQTLKIEGNPHKDFELNLGYRSINKLILKSIDSLKKIYFTNNNYLDKIQLENIKYVGQFTLDNTSLKDSIIIKNTIQFNEVIISNNRLLKTIPDLLLNSTYFILTNNKEIKQMYVLNNDRINQLQILNQGLTNLKINNCSNIEKIYINNISTSDSIKIEKLPELKDLTIISFIKNNVLNLTQFTKLEKLILQKIQVSELIISNFPNLELLSLNNTNTPILFIQDLTRLKVIELKNIVPLNKLKIKNLPSLKSLNLSETALIDSINLSDLGDLDTFIFINQSTSSTKYIDLSSLPSLLYLKISGFENASTFNLNNLPNLQTLWLFKNSYIQYLDVTKYKELKNLILGSLSQVTTLSISDLDSLTYAVIDNNNNLNLINLNNLEKLEWFDCGNNPNITKISLKNLKSLYHIGFQFETSLDSLILDDLDIISYFEISNTDLSFLEIKNLNNLTELIINNNRIKEFNYDSLAKLEHLDISNNEITRINLKLLNSLNNFNCSFNKIQSLEAPKFHNRYSLFNCKNNDVSYIDIQNCNKLENFICSENQFLTHLYIRGTRFFNNQPNPNRYFIYGNSNLKFICCDDDLIDGWKYIAENLGYDVGLLEFNTNCEYSPDGMFYIVKGNIKYDINNNGCDTNDYEFNELKFILQNEYVQIEIIPNSSGNYFLPLPASNNLIQVKLNFPELFKVTPDSINFTFPGLSDTMDQDFCVTPSKIERVLNLSIIPLTVARPGFDASYRIVITNNGNQVDQGTVHFTYNESILDFVSAEITPTVQNDGLLSWNFTDLLPGQTIDYEFVLNLNSPTESPALNIGDELKLTCNVLDDAFTLNQEVVGSYDPNDKTCLEGKFLKPEMVGEYIHYLIRFENTGSYPAENIRVFDILDTNVFEVSSIIIVESSHEMYAKIKGNIIEFIFDNILLPFDDTSNDGYICFKIKTKPSLVLGDELKNKANIYFDYNIPIETNETSTIVALPLRTNETNGVNPIEIFPNPVSGVLKFSGADKILKAEIFDMSGRLLQVSNVVNGEVNVERLFPGMYQISLKTKNGTVNKMFSKL